MSARPLLSAVLLLAAGAAAPAVLPAALGPRYGGDLTLALEELPEVVAGSPASSAAQRCLAGLQQQTLLELGADGAPRPALAAGWSSAASGREWTLRLDPAATFHDGRPVAADDALRSLRRFLRAPSAAAASLAEQLEGGAAFRSGASEDLPGLAAPDPGRVVLRVSAASARPLAPLAAPAAAVTSATGVGAGPFVPTLRLPDRQTFTAFAGHVRGRPFVDALHVVALADERVRDAELRSGRVDLAPGDGDVRELSGTLLLVLDATLAPFREPEARASLAATIDTADLARHFLPGGDPATTLLTPLLLPPLAPETPAPAGSYSGRLTLVVARDVPPLASQRIVARLGAAGMAVSVQALEPGAARGARTAARLLLFQPEVPDPGLALAELEALAPCAEARRALASAAVEPDPDRRRVALYRAEAALRQESVLVPLAAAPTAFRAGPGVHGARVDLGGRLLLEDAWREP